MLVLTTPLTLTGAPEISSVVPSGPAPTKGCCATASGAGATSTLMTIVTRPSSCGIVLDNVRAVSQCFRTTNPWFPCPGGETRGAGGGWLGPREEAWGSGGVTRDCT